MTIQYVLMQSGEDFKDPSLGVVMSTEILKPLWNSSNRLASNSIMFFLSLILFVLDIGNISLSLVVFFLLLVFDSLPLSLPYLQFPSQRPTINTTSMLLIPIIDLLDLLLDKAALRLCPFLWIAVAAALIMLSAVMYPNILWNLTSA